MDLALNGLNFNMCLVYLDDIIVYSSTVEEHLLKLRKLFDRLRIADLKLKHSKCSLLRAEVNFLGHVVSGEGVATDSSKIELVKDWPTPSDVKVIIPRPSELLPTVPTDICGDCSTVTCVNCEE